MPRQRRKGFSRSQRWENFRGSQRESVPLRSLLHSCPTLCSLELENCTLVAHIYAINCKLKQHAPKLRPQESQERFEIHAQQSEDKLYKRLEKVSQKEDTRPIVLAYGLWGTVAGKAGCVSFSNVSSFCPVWHVGAGATLPQLAHCTLTKL